MAMQRSIFRRLSFLSVASLLISASALGAATLIGACGGSESDGSGTTGFRVVLKTKATSADPVNVPFTNEKGWVITLDELAISVGAFYYFDGAPIFSTATALLPVPTEEAPSWQDPAMRFLGLGTAFANPGHYKEGNAKGQMLEPLAIDLSQGVVDLPDGDGVSGIFRSGRFSYADPTVGPGLGVLEGHLIRIAGTAEKDGMSKIFRMFADMKDVVDSYNLPKLDGCEFKEVDVEADGTVTMSIYPSLWLGQAEFDAIPDSTDGEPVLLDDTTQPHRAFQRGIKKGDAYKFEYAPN